MNFADFIAPVPVQTFLQHFDQAPLHIPGDGDAAERRRGLMAWGQLNALLGVAGHWREENIKLILNGAGVPSHYYLDAVSTQAGTVQRADPAKIDSLLGMGASLVANAAEDASFELKQITAMLSAEFLGTSGANVYCSFRGVQAFRSHVDLSDVFAVHCEGEKVWRIYRDRAQDPVEQHSGPEAQAVIDRAKGPLLMEVRMRPGDLLYIPRGYYHDALASSDASLHVTFSVARHTARILFRILERMAMLEPEFRAYLPDGRIDQGKALATRVELLASRVKEIMRTPAFAFALRAEQLELAKPFRALTLPQRTRPTLLKRGRHQWRIDQTAAGAVLRWNGGEIHLGSLEKAAHWLLNQDFVPLQLLHAHFPQLGEPALEGLAQDLLRAGLVEPYDSPPAPPSPAGHVTTRVR